MRLALDCRPASGVTGRHFPIAVQDELRSGRLVEYAVVPDLEESFYAISVLRRYEPPLLKTLLGQTETAVLGTSPG